MNKTIFKQAAANLEHNERSWLATVINADGSTPAKIGMKILIGLEGELNGTIGGGAIEKIVVDKVRAEQPFKPVRWSFDLDGNSAFAKTGMICGGIQEILVDPLFNHHDLYIIGGGHCGKALAEFAARCNFNVTVIDDRPEIAKTELLPFATRIICSPYEQIEQHINFSQQIFIVAMTHGHAHDQLVIEKILPHEYKYFGVIGSKKKVTDCFAKLTAKGFSKEQLQTIYAPIGFAIGSQTPMEVAASILAQLIAVRNGKTEITFNSNVLL